MSCTWIAKSYGIVVSPHRHEPDIALKLIEKGVDVNTDRDHTYLYTVSVYGYDKIAQALVGQRCRP